jgi:hypothetical protein
MREIQILTSPKIILENLKCGFQKRMALNGLFHYVVRVSIDDSMFAGLLLNI